MSHSTSLLTTVQSRAGSPLFGAALLAFASLLPVAATAAVAPPLDWCAGVKPRMDYVKEHRKAQMAALGRTKTGSVLIFEVEEREGAKGTPFRFKEEWKVISIDTVANKANLEVTRIGKDGFRYKEEKEHALLIVEETTDAEIKADKSNCSHPFMFAHRFGKARRDIAGRSISVLWREQYNISRADFRQVVSPNVPLGIVEEVLKVGTQGGSGIKERTSRLVGFRF